MKKIFIGIGVVIGVLAIGFLALLIYSGLFTKATISEREIGPYTYIYKEFVGDYAKTGPVFTEVANALKTQNIKSEIGLGQYFDDPKVVAKEKLRSHCGMVIADKDIAKAKKLDSTYKLATYTKAPRIVAKFKTKTMLSYMIGPMKVYPQLMKYANQKDYKINELGYEIYFKNYTLYPMSVTKK